MNQTRKKKYSNIHQNILSLLLKFVLDKGYSLLLGEKTSEQASQPEREAAPKKMVTHKEVRTLLAEISRSGKTSEVKQLITFFGAARLSDIEESKYAELMEKARTL